MSAKFIWCRLESLLARRRRNWSLDGGSITSELWRKYWDIRVKIESQLLYYLLIMNFFSNFGGGGFPFGAQHAGD